MHRGFRGVSLLAISLGLSLHGAAWADPGCGSCGDGGCASCGSAGCGHCNNHHCPPPFVWCMERPPCIKYKCACPRPVCDPCNLEHYGYYQTCWRPWDYPPDWSHCPVPPPGAMLPAPPYPPYTPKVPIQYPRPDERRRDLELPSPRPVDPGQPTVRVYH